MLAQAERRGGRILDFGCGNGSIVLAGLERGLDIWGVEDFSAAASDTPHEHASGPLSERLKVITAGSELPFPKAHFDFIFSNQVFEHVSNPNRVLAELARVLKPGKQMLNVFPTREVWQEWHYGVPLSHRLVGTRFLKPYLRAAHALGLGYLRQGMSRDQWVAAAAAFLNDMCFYRPYHELVTLFTAAGFTVEHEEISYLNFRLRNRFPVLTRVLRPVVEASLRRLTDAVVLCTKALDA